MNPLRHLTEKPWIASDAVAGEALDARSLAAIAGRNVLKIFFAIIAVLFLLLTIAYGERMTWEDWRPLPEPNLLWFNTLALVLSSAAMQWALYSLDRQRMTDARLGVLCGGLTAVVFMAGQLLAWRQLMEMGYFKATNPAIAFFVLITALHGLHILGGLVALARVAMHLFQDREGQDMRLGLDLCTRYWHFLLVVWLVLFGLLFSGNNNLATLLALCGLR